MNSIITKTALALAASGMAVTAIPASAADFHRDGYRAAPVEDSWNQNRNRDRDRNRDRYQRGYDSRYGYAEPVYRDTRVWRGNDGRTYCQKKDGTTGLIIGGAAGALLGREIDGGRNRTLGTVLGAAAGALLGKEIAQGNSCR